jgi:AcrR family transcriptional regulator
MTTRLKPYHHGDLRESIIHAGEKLLREKGLDGFTLRAVARMAGVSAAAPSHHFGNITGIFSSMAARGFVRLKTTVDTIANEMNGDELDALARGYVSFARENRYLFRLMFDCEKLNWEQPDLSVASQQSLQQLCGIIRGKTHLESLDAEFVVPELTSETVAVLGIIHGFAHLLVEDQLSFFAPGTNDLDLAESCMRSILKLLRKS